MSGIAGGVAWTTLDRDPRRSRWPGPGVVEVVALGAGRSHLPATWRAGEVAWATPEHGQNCLAEWARAVFGSWERRGVPTSVVGRGRRPTHMSEAEGTDERGSVSPEAPRSRPAGRTRARAGPAESRHAGDHSGRPLRAPSTGALRSHRPTGRPRRVLRSSLRESQVPSHPRRERRGRYL